MNVQRQQQRPALGAPMAVPQTFFEWLCSVYSPDEYVFQQQYYGTTVIAAQAASNNGNISVLRPIFVLGFRSFGFNTATGAAPTFPYSIGIAQGSGNDWTQGQWASRIVTGDSQFQENQFYWPREVAMATQLTVTVNNSRNAAVGVTVDATIVGLEVRQRSEPIRRAFG